MNKSLFKLCLIRSLQPWYTTLWKQFWWYFIKMKRNMKLWRIGSTANRYAAGLVVRSARSRSSLSHVIPLSPLVSKSGAQLRIIATPCHAVRDPYPKGICSGLWVKERGNDSFLRMVSSCRSWFLSPTQTGQYFSRTVVHTRSLCCDKMDSWRFPLSHKVTVIDWSRLAKPRFCIVPKNARIAWPVFYPIFGNFLLARWLTDVMM